MGSSKTMATSILFILLLVSTTLPPAFSCKYCSDPSHPRPTSTHPSHSKRLPPREENPPPYTGGSPPSWSLTPPSTGSGGLLPWINLPPPAKCSLEILKLGLCLDVLGGLVHVGLGNAVENYCCPVIQGLLELEAAVCLCTAIKLRVLNLNIYIPLTLQVLITCGKDPPPGYVCPLN